MSQASGSLPTRGEQPTQKEEPRTAPLQWSVDIPRWVALGAVFCGWFLLDTVSMTVGEFRDGFRFYQLAAIIEQPLRLVTGVNGPTVHSVMPFALVCLAALAAPLAPRLTGHAWAPLGELVPLALMLLCGTILYIEASRDAFVAPPDASSVAKAMTGFANSMSRRAGGVLASHIVVGSGAWIALLGAGYLTLRGLGSARGAR